MLLFSSFLNFFYHGLASEIALAQSGAEIVQWLRV